uniref:Uncharacterized protein n=1 Tax=Pantoea phage Survivor TaxID=3232176 RepID=A0AAU8L139_9CAUD
MFKWLAKVLGVSIKRGSTRTVVIWGKKVYKFPRCKSLDTFFKGLTCNHKERLMSHCCPNYFVPVLFSIPGLLVVMPKVKTLPEACPLVRSFMFDLFHHSRNEEPEAQVARYYCEYITDNYGMYKGKPMCIDYGTFMPLAATREDMQRELDMQEWDVKRRLGIKDEIEEVVQPVEEPYQICLELLDFSKPPSDVAGKYCEQTHGLHDVEAQVYGPKIRDAGSRRFRGTAGLAGDFSGAWSIPLPRHQVPYEALQTTVVLN